MHVFTGDLRLLPIFSSVVPACCLTYKASYAPVRSSYSIRPAIECWLLGVGAASLPGFGASREGIHRQREFLPPPNYWRDLISSIQEYDIANYAFTLVIY